MKHLIVSVILFFYILNSEANVCSFGTKVFFGNGMFNTKEDALQSMKRLQELNLTEIENPKALEFDLAYNKNESKALNVLSVLVQKLGND